MVRNHFKVLKSKREVFSLGLSNYNTYEMYQLYKSLNSLEAGMEVIAHSILEEDSAITHIKSNLAHLSATWFILQGLHHA